MDGTLRKATWEERERMNQIFFPISGRGLEPPKLFESPYFEVVVPVFIIILISFLF